MKKTVRIISLIILSVIFIISAVSVSFALSTADANEQIDESRSCSLKLTYAADEVPVEGLEIEVYQVASVTSDMRYSMTGDFSSYAIEINGIKTQGEWDAVKDTVGSYIIADGVAPTGTGYTDEDGVVLFEELPVGIYYVRWTHNETYEIVEGFAPFLIAVPELGEDGLWIYDVDALPKPGTVEDPFIDMMTIIKLWRDGSKSALRPESISVDIYCDGELYDSIELTEEDDWMYSWDVEGVYSWTAVERDVPGDYTVLIENVDENTIQITNSIPEEVDPIVQTGDSLDLYFWIALLGISGIALVIVSICGKKVNEE